MSCLSMTARLAIAPAGLVLAGCGHHHAAVSANLNTAGNPTVDMMVVSTRERSTKPGEIYSGERADKRSLYNLVISLPPDGKREIGKIQWPSSSKPNPRTEFVTTKAVSMQPADVDRWFLNVASKNHKLFVFVHGFNTNFDETAYRFAHITHDSGTDAAPVLFTWPSRGRVLGYVYDTASAIYSRDDLEFVLTRAARDPNVSEITVMAHSLGSLVMMEALRQMSIRDGRIDPKIKNVVMSSPDIDVGVFREELEQITGPRPLTTIFTSRDDVALGFSRSIAGDIDRIGSVDAELPEYQAQLKEFNIQVIDLTKLKGNGANHGKFAESPEIVRLIGSRLLAGQQISGRDLTLGETLTGATVDGNPQIPVSPRAR